VDLLDWSRQVRAVSDPVAFRLVTAAERRPEEAEQVYRRAVRLRTALHDVVVAAAHDHPASADDLAIVNQEVGPLLAASRLEPLGEAYVLARADEQDTDATDPPLDRVLWSVLRSAIALLTSRDELERVRECPGDGCGWVFYDASGRRRWCSMTSCGTLHKVRRFRERQRSGST
jgi:predicted RNA-binding Zn ribbon-like protein